jgi:hypothetical protein
MMKTSDNAVIVIKGKDLPMTMEVKFTKAGIVFDKVLNQLDDLVIDTTAILNDAGVNYVIISGYVAILFGRSRSSEDVDMIIKRMDRESFGKVWDGLIAKFDCINASSADDAFESLQENVAIRFARKKEFMPNMEIKFNKTVLDRRTLEDKQKVILNGNEFFISPFEMQIAFKLQLGSEKDIEDARHLYGIFKDRLDMHMLDEAARKLEIQELIKRYL